MTGDLIERLHDEADLCRNEGADDVARLLDEAADALEAARAELENSHLQEITTVGQLQTALEELAKVRATHLQTAPDAWIRTGDDLDDAADAISDAVLAQEQKRDQD